jgi:hypothetical protein
LKLFVEDFAMKKVGIVLFIVALWAGAANAAQGVIGVNFGGGNDALAGETADDCSNWTDSGGGANSTQDLAVLGTDGLVTCTWTSSNTWSGGSNVTSEQQLYHSYLDDGSGGARIIISGLGDWMRAVGASSYIVRIYQCTDHWNDGSTFGPSNITDGQNVLETLQIQMTDVWTTNNSDMRGFAESGELTSDTIHIEGYGPPSGGNVRGCIAGFRITAVSGAAAGNPNPADGEEDVPADTELTWSRGIYAATHDVYFGTSFEDVNNASRTAPAGLLVSQGQDANAYDPPGVLQYGQTYYWRIDEVNGAPDNTIFKGEVWSFTVEPVSYPVAGVIATASGSGQASTGPEKTIDGSGLNANDEHGTATDQGWISAKGDPQWIQYEMPHVSKLDKMLVWNSNQTLESLFGFGVKDVTIEVSLDGTDWTTLGAFEFAQATGLPDYTANTTVDLAGAVAKFVRLTINSNWGGIFQQYGLSEVRFFSIPIAAREPKPSPGTTDLHPRVAMSWRAGREAASHELYIGTDPDAIADGAVAPITLTRPQYDFAADLGQSYSWKVVEVNQAADPSAWASSVWSFSTATYISVDDFESYTNRSPKRVFQTWIDGAGFSADEFFPNGNSGNGSGSYAGYDPQLGNIMETTFVYGGRQSLPLYYDNDAAPRYSEATRTFDPAKDTTDWSKHGITMLVLFFRGDVNNVGAPVYVKINGTKVVYNNGAASTTSPVWKQWNIPLASFGSALKNVTSLTVGVGDGSAGGTGTILVDEIRLYATAPEIAVPSDPGKAGMVAWYTMEGNVNDGSGNGNNGTAGGEPAYVNGLASMGKALAFDGINDCVDLGNKAAFNPAGSFSVSLWANIGAWGTAWNHVMVGNRGEDNVGWQVRRHSGTGLCFTTRGVGQDDTASVMTPPLSEWIHITCVYDNAANTKTIYVNGTPDTVVTTSAGATIAATTHNTYIGARAVSANTGPEAFFTGNLDDVRIYNRALSEGEARYLAGDR